MPKIHHGNASRLNSCPCSPSSVLKIKTAREGVIVRALMAEMIVDTAIVTANWRKNWPVIPPMKQHGTNTELSAKRDRQDRPGDLLHRLDRRGPRSRNPWRSCRSVFSSTTMASSTTMPMASTSPKSVRLLRLKPMAAMTANVPIKRDRHVDHRQDHRPPVLQEDQDDDADEDDRIAQGLEHLVDRLADVRRGVVGDVVVDAVGEARLELFHLGPHPVGDVERVGAGKLVDREPDRRVTVKRARLVIILGTHLDAGHVAQADDGPGADPVQSLLPTLTTIDSNCSGLGQPADGIDRN